MGQYLITDKTISDAYQPFDVVTNKNGDVGFVQEVSCNECQDDPKWQISYAVCWVVGNENKHAWWRHKELKKHCNLMFKIAENMCHPFGGNDRFVERIFNTKQ